MSDWQDTFMDQDNPQAMGKIWANVVDIKNLLLDEDDLVDIGCCKGHMFEALNHPNYTGIDFSQDNIDFAKAEYPEAKFEVGNLFDLTGSWDFVLCCRVLMHLPDFEVAIEKLKSLARRKLVVVIPIGHKGSFSVEQHKYKKTYFQTFSVNRVLDTGGRIIRHPKYSTVVYDR